ncbi:FAD-dependent oxidoreductase [Streptomyces griseoruber]|uniref:2-polyprenyl-6-methoxyphenol hydroxylase n=1 Tax=Streptomyces griseoruber TaxID=1943 RepID=A0A101T9J6_9ACTN|nr:FAD-dependent oxidoreductase [Streptomyces griseoruber]KUN88133.1 2-polyprenyl-6-methoxyphenol hydroxylase [Streptomyces griseoruber]
MITARRVLVIGGGFAGNTVTILLRRAGLTVDLVEAKPDWNATTGSGITVQGNALRVLRELGLWEQVESSGFPFGSLGITAPDGTLLHVVEDIRTGGEDLPATLGMRRPQLQQILSDAVRACGATVRLGTTAEILDQGTKGVRVRFSDGTEGRYALVIGADGLNSATRAMIGITDKPEPTGQAIWRTPAPRPADVTRTDLTFGGPAYAAGYCPTSESTLYAYVVEACRGRDTIPPGSYADEMRRLADQYGGVWPEIAQHITDPGKINYTWYHRLLVEGSWHRGRIVLIGDAVHCCPPSLAQGAAMSLEDALVLAELLTSGRDWDDDLFQTYYERRIPRVRTVVDASVQLGQWQLDEVRGDVLGLIGRSMTLLKALP